MDASVEQINALYEEVERVAFEQGATVQDVIAALAARIGLEVRLSEGAF